MRLDIRFYEWGNNMAEFLAIGTAINRFAPRDTVPRPRLVLTLDD